MNKPEASQSTKLQDASYYILLDLTLTEILPVLEDAIEKHISEYGVTEFIVGHYSGFDRLAARALVSAKKRHPEVRPLILIPYHPAECSVDTPQGFDNTFCPPGMEKVPRKLAIVRANQYLVDHVDYLIADTWHPTMHGISWGTHRKKVYHLSICANLSSMY